MNNPHTKGVAATIFAAMPFNPVFKILKLAENEE
jgi:hypothetical protein